MTKKYHESENIIMNEEEEDEIFIDNGSLIQETLDNDINYLIVNMKIEMMDYVNSECVPLLEHFDYDTWRKVIDSIL